MHVTDAEDAFLCYHFVNNTDNLALKNFFTNLLLYWQKEALNILLIIHEPSNELKKEQIT